jgi:hypothetical protein
VHAERLVEGIDDLDLERRVIGAATPGVATASINRAVARDRSFISGSSWWGQDRRWSAALAAASYRRRRV